MLGLQALASQAWLFNADSRMLLLPLACPLVSPPLGCKCGIVHVSVHPTSRTSSGGALVHLRNVPRGLRIKNVGLQLGM